LIGNAITAFIIRIQDLTWRYLRRVRKRRLIG
jgi:hypothetical protein